MLESDEEITVSSTMSVSIMASQNHSLQALRSALEQGWRIQAPVYFRQRWHTNNGQKLGYYFILKKGDDTDLFVVPDDDQVRRLIELRRLKVIAA